MVPPGGVPEQVVALAMAMLSARVCGAISNTPKSTRKDAIRIRREPQQSFMQTPQRGKRNKNPAVGCKPGPKRTQTRNSICFQRGVSESNFIRGQFCAKDFPFVKGTRH